MSKMNEQKSIREEMKMLKQKMADLASKIISKTFDDKLTVKIGEKGNLVIYGLGRFPVSLYASQAARLGKLLGSADFQEFVTQNAESLAKKTE
jgi:hypothetical protein